MHADSSHLNFSQDDIKYKINEGAKHPLMVMTRFFCNRNRQGRTPALNAAVMRSHFRRGSRSCGNRG